MFIALTGLTDREDPSTPPFELYEECDEIVGTQRSDILKLHITV